MKPETIKIINEHLEVEVHSLCGLIKTLLESEDKDDQMAGVELLAASLDPNIKTLYAKASETIEKLTEDKQWIGSDKHLKGSLKTLKKRLEKRKP